VIPVFCTHQPGGRLALTFDAPWNVTRGDEDRAVARYLARLEAEVLAHPADAVAHLLWHCYGPESDPDRALSKRRKPRRRHRLAAADATSSG
jgi:hypothetical protein